MKRWGFLILVCLLLGVVTTVAVAWACAVSVDVRFNQRQPDALSSEKRGKESDRWCELQLFEWKGFGSSRWLLRGIGVIDSPAWMSMRPGPLTPHEAAPAVPRLTSAIRNADPSTLPASPMIESRGWPAQALWCEITWEQTTGHMTSALKDGGIALPWLWPRQRYGRFEPRVLPVFPLWPGFVIDAFIFAGAWGSAYGILLLLRAYARTRRRGLCTKCGYSLTGNTSGKCPECGAETTEAMASS